MSAHARRLEPLAGYLKPGEAQSRLAAKMASDHARERHGDDLGGLGVRAFRQLATRHLANAPRAWVIAPPGKRPRCYLVSDPHTGLIAWIPPHKEHRATLFKPEQGAEAFTATRLVVGTQRGQRWTEVDVRALRGHGRGIGSADRRPPEAGLGR